MQTMMLWNTLANAIVPPPAPRLPQDEGWIDQLGLSSPQRLKLLPLVQRWRKRHQEACDAWQTSVETHLEPRQLWRLKRVGDVMQLPLSEAQRALFRDLNAGHQARLEAQRHAFQLLADTILTPWQRKLLAGLLEG